jgi:aminoglycoside phosphotransferase (APT) family kinase protein
LQDLAQVEEWPVPNLEVLVGAQKMHADEVETDAALVRRLVAAQFPRWAGLPIAPVPSNGTDNALYRLGADLVVRLPRIPWAAGLAAKEHRWLPRLAPHLPLAVPVPLALGAPGQGYPWRWTVCRWLAGESAAAVPLDDPRDAAARVARFLTALRRIDATGGPPAGPASFFRGVPLAARDAVTRAASAALRGRIDAGAVTAAWEAALRAPVWDGPPVWLHGDLYPANLLVAGGQLSAVIDFGCLGVGDPACDLLPAWTLFSGGSRDAFRAALGVDAATWARGRGWALSLAVGAVAHPYYPETNPTLVAAARRALDAVLAEHRSGA